jgi:nitrogen fixation protein NifU and related proteins
MGGRSAVVIQLDVPVGDTDRSSRERYNRRKSESILVGKYSETLMDHVMAPRNGGGMEHHDLTGHAGTPGQGAFLIMFLRVEDGHVADAKYRTYGCGPTIAAGSMLTELVVGRTIAECRELTVENLIEALDGVPPDKLH